MQRVTVRDLALLGVLALGAWGAAAGSPSYAPAVGSAARAPTPQTTGAGAEDSGMPGYTLHTDVAGWYAVTPEERAVRAAYDLRSEALPASLPLALGEWHGVELGRDAQIDALYAQPELALRRSYTNARGQVLWLTAIGARGAASYRLFEHTPPICYASAGWCAADSGVKGLALAHGALPVRRDVFTQGQAMHIVYSWYQWDDPARTPEAGIVAWRLVAEAGVDATRADDALGAFVRALYREVLPWHRF